MRILTLVLLLASCGLAQQDTDASRLRGKPPCTATRVTNCIPTVDASGVLSAGNVAAVGIIPNTIVLFGDSITANNINVSATANSWLDLGYFTYLNALLGQRFRVLANAGITSNTTTQMLARIQTDVIAYHPAYCIIEAGVNDLHTSVPAATIWANLKAIYTALQSAGIRVIALTILPTSWNTAGNVADWALVNSKIREYAKTQPNFLVLEAAAAYVDPTSATAQPKANYTNDGVHPSGLGAAAIALAAYPILNAAIPAFPTLPTTYAGDPGNLVASGTNFMVGTGGALTAGVTGSIAAGWSAQKAGTITGVASKGTRSDGVGGETQIITISAGTDINSSVGIAYLLPSFTIGTSVYLQAEVLAANTTFDIVLYCFDGSFTTLMVTGGVSASIGTVLNTNAMTSMVFRSPTITIPVGTIYAQVAINVRGTAGAVTLGRIEVRQAATF